MPHFPSLQGILYHKQILSSTPPCFDVHTFAVRSDASSRHSCDLFFPFNRSRVRAVTSSGFIANQGGCSRIHFHGNWRLSAGVGHALLDQLAGPPPPRPQTLSSVAPPQNVGMAEELVARRRKGNPWPTLCLTVDPYDLTRLLLYVTRYFCRMTRLTKLRQKYLSRSISVN